MLDVVFVAAMVLLTAVPPRELTSIERVIGGISPT